MSEIWKQLSWVTLPQSFSADASQAVDQAEALSRLHWGRICFQLHSRGCWRPQFLPTWASPNVATGCSRVSDSRGTVGMHPYSVYYTDQCWGDISQGWDHLGWESLGTIFKVGYHWCLIFSPNVLQLYLHGFSLIQFKKMSPLTDLENELMVVGGGDGGKGWEGLVHTAVF